jgi:hypothetical protein
LASETIGSISEDLFAHDEEALHKLVLINIAKVHFSLIRRQKRALIDFVGL